MFSTISAPSSGEKGYENLLLVEIQIPSVRKSSVADGLSIQEILENWLKLNEFNELNESGQR